MVPVDSGDRSECQQHFTAWRADVCDCLDAAVGSSGLPSPLQEAIRYGSTAPDASRWRALLVLEVARALGKDPAAALHAAAAVEALHCATLSIDDLPSMDDAAERRGVPAMHRRFNEAMAIQASLWLLGVSRTLMAAAVAAKDGTSADIASRLSALQQQTENELQLGQFMDMMGSLGKAEIDVEQVARLKCGRLFALAAQAAAWLPPQEGSAGEVAKALDIFGEEVGLAYQILDDLADVGEDDAAATWGGDGERGRPTVVGTHGLAEARQRIDACLERAAAALAPLASQGIDAQPLARIARTMLGRG